jgi:hypothetical protein
MAAESCAQALELAIVTLEELPGLALTAAELAASVGVLLATEEIGFGAVAEATAIAALLRRAYTQALQISTDAAAFLNAALNCVLSFIRSAGGSAGGGKPVVATQPVPSVVEGPGAGVCSTKSGNRGICCAAVTQLGLSRAAQGFQYVNCNGKTVCLACGTKTSISKKNPGATVFSVKRVSCGPSGCPALGQLQGTIVQPV